MGLQHLTPQQYLAKYPIVSDQMSHDELVVLLRELARTIQNEVAGDVVELGCYEGTSALFMARVIRDYTPSKQLWLYDSFQGLPPKTAQDASPAGNQFVAGQLHASRQRLEQHFKRAGLPLPHIKKAWFADLVPSDFPPAVAFAFLDGDFYESIRGSLAVVWPLLSQGGVLVIDDYQNEALPGAARAVDEFACQRHLDVRAEKSLAIIRMPIVPPARRIA